MAAGIAQSPSEFIRAVEALRNAHLRSELVVREIPAPERIAPHSVAFGAGISAAASSTTADGAPDDELNSPLGAGRLVLMYDPASADEWGGSFRIVCFAQAPLELEIGIDPFIADVAWSWLVDALDARGAQYTYLSGTATKVLSTSYGAIAHRGDAAQLELRASWTPLGESFASHAEAWSELLCLLAGLPHHEGIGSLDAHRARKSSTTA